ncbi:LamG-like jellyroll fold domain-containing protein [Roseospira marina]|nr:LamG-like jellyroll fold domain-containing protein [Roseospira marina]MBB4314071.1 hypothetical protein [Roseospira marina]MBB5087232.1 hypothetical protein [Roseospira marina]
MAAILVTSLQDLVATLNSVKGGETIALAAGNYGGLTIDGGSLPNLQGLSAPVTITSADPGHPATFSGLNVSDAANLTFDGVTFDYDAAPGSAWWDKPFQVNGSSNITIRDAIFDGDVAEGTHSILDGYGTGFGLYVKGSTGVTVENSHFSMFRQGIVVADSEDTRVLGNEIVAMSGDGIKGSELQTALIEGNYVHDFVTAPGDDWHFDLIQIFANYNGGIAPSSDVTIRGNVLDNGSGVATQSIFVGVGGGYEPGSDPDFHYSNILIEDNLIHNALKNAIAEERTDGAIIRNNTLVHNTDVDATASSVPSIVTNPESTNVQIYNNILPGTLTLAATDGASAAWNNIITQTDDPSAPTYLGKVFADAFGGATTDLLTDLQVLPDSVAAGLGASLSAFDTTPDTLTAAIQVQGGTLFAGEAIALDAGLTRDAAGLVGDGAHFVWTVTDTDTGARVQAGEGSSFAFRPDAVGEYTAQLIVTQADGTVATNTTQVSVADSRLMAHDFSGGSLRDGSSYGGAATLNNGAALVSVDGRTALHLTADSSLTLGDRGANDELYSLNAFTLEMGLQRDRADGGAGVLFNMHGATTVSVTDTGEVSVDFKTLNGDAVSLTTHGAGITDTAWHHLAVSYDAAQGDLLVFVDGALLGQAEASGASLTELSWVPTMGRLWGRSFEGNVSHVTMSSTALDADDAAALDTGFEGMIRSGGSLDAMKAFTAGEADSPVDAAPSAPTPVWHLNETLDVDGDSAPDAVFQGDMAFATEADGNVYVDGNGGYLDVQDPAMLFGRDQVSLFVDMRLDDMPDGRTRVLWQKDMVTVSADDDGGLTFQVYDEAGGRTNVRVGDAGIDAGAWHNVGFAIDTEADRFNAYVDGQLVASETIDVAVPDASDWGLWLGGSPWGDRVDAGFDNLAVYDTFIDAATADVLFNADHADLAIA